MKRWEALVVLSVAVTLVVSGVVILFGPFGLIGSGAAIAAAVLTLDLKD